MSQRIAVTFPRRVSRTLRRVLPVRRRRGRTGAVLRLALPAVSEQLLNMTVGLADTWLVGHLGADPIAAVSISNQIVMLAQVLCSSIATGSTALIARCVGAQDAVTANRAVGQSMLVAVLIGLGTTAAGVGFAGQAARLMGATGNALPMATAYLRIVSWSLMLMTCLFVGNACLRGAGDTLSAMRVMMLVNAINIVVAAALIYGPFGLPRLGVVGSALGAAAGRSVGGIVVLVTLWRGRAGLRLHWRRMVPDVSVIRRILRIGIPTGIEMLLFRFGDMSYYRVVTSLGMAACAAHAITLNAQSLSFSPGFGFAMA
ncbi:MAG: MATE family efflux transporter, partial [Anaerolineae bacterium]|nr:MATE family efflux transporter [Anaerolineae bacterium]